MNKQKTSEMFAEVYGEWALVWHKYAQPVNFPFLAILTNCSRRQSVQINGICLHRGRNGSSVHLATDKGKIDINKKNIWRLDKGQTHKKETIFTKELNFLSED